MLFPMYTVPVKAILSMTTLEPHEALKLQGLLVEFDKTMGKALFVSQASHVGGAIHRFLDGFV